VSAPRRRRLSPGRRRAAIWVVSGAGGSASVRREDGDCRRGAGSGRSASLRRWGGGTHCRDDAECSQDVVAQHPVPPRRWRAPDVTNDTALPSSVPKTCSVTATPRGRGRRHGVSDDRPGFRHTAERDGCRGLRSAGLNLPRPQPRRINSAATSPITIAGAFVWPRMTVGITDASATRSPSTPRTRSSGSTTESASVPMRAVPTGW
jgi:hypothetical protein